MVIIRKQDNHLAQPMPIVIENWEKYDYKVTTTAYVSYDDLGFCVRFVTTEPNPVRIYTNHFDPVHKDSCVELFANFDPEHSDCYINFEVNANGVMDCAFRKNRYISKRIKASEIDDFGINTDITPEQWIVSYHIPFKFIRSYYPQFNINTCRYITGNLYKCCEETSVYHLLTYFPMPADNDDFHNPSAFQKILIET